MAVRNVAKNFTLEQQRQQVNLIGADLGDISSLNTPLPNTLARAINYLDGTVSSYEGTVWYVSTNGVDSIDNDPTSAGYRKNPGRTRNVAFRTVKYALSQASFGDTIHIGPGTFQDLTIASPYAASSAITGYTTQALYVNVNTGSGNVANTATIAVYGDVVSF